MATRRPCTPRDGQASLPATRPAGSSQDQRTDTAEQYACAGGRGCAVARHGPAAVAPQAHDRGLQASWGAPREGHAMTSGATAPGRELERHRLRERRFLSGTLPVSPTRWDVALMGEYARTVAAGSRTTTGVRRPMTSHRTKHPSPAGKAEGVLLGALGRPRAGSAQRRGLRRRPGSGDRGLATPRPQAVAHAAHDRGPQGSQQQPWGYAVTSRRRSGGRWSAPGRPRSG